MTEQQIQTPSTFSTFTNGGVDVFVAITLKHGIKLYAKTGMKPNRMWTPTNMLAKATQITGKKFSGKDKYNLAVQELTAWIEIHRPQEVATGNIR